MRKIKDIVSAICLFFLFLNPAFAQSTAAILPEGKTQFLDNNGNPLSSGKVDFYIPSTTTRKTTWQDAAKTIANANPVVLDAGGRAIIYGDGTYRQVVKTSTNTTIYDVVTASAGTGGGTTGTGDGDLVGTIKPWAGLIAPNQYVFAYGQEISRSTYAAFFTASTLNQIITCTSGSPVLTNLSDTTQIPNGAVIEATCIAAGSIVINKTSNTVTMNSNASLSTSTTSKFFLYGNGNGSTTFNVPDLRGRFISGRDNMGGTAANRLIGATTGSSGGNQTATITTPNLPPYSPGGGIAGILTVGNGGVVVTDPGHIHTLSTAASNVVNGAGVGGSANLTGGGGALNQGAITVNTATTGISVAVNLAIASAFTGTPQGGTSTPISIVPPALTLNYIIKITPDSNNADASGVTSLGGMVGDIACGAGILCTGNIISVTAATLPTGGSTSQCLLKSSATNFNAFWYDCGSYVKPFGALCDGVTNDYPAILAALTAASTGSKIVIFPPGTCRAFTTLTMPSAMTIKGSGRAATLISSSASIGINGNGFATQLYDFAITTNNAGTAIKLSGNYNVVNNISTSTNLVGLDCSDCGATWIQNSEFQTSSNAALQIEAPINPDGGDNWVQNNYISNAAIPGTGIGVSQTSGGGWKYFGNKFLLFQRGIWLSANFGSHASSALQIQHNSIEGCALECIVISNTNANADVLFNTIISNNQGGSNGAEFIKIFPKNVSTPWLSIISINGNIIRNNTTTNCITVDGVVTGLSILDNNCGNTGTGTTGITVGANSNNGFIALNIITNYTTKVTNAGTNVTATSNGP